MLEFSMACLPDSMVDFRKKNFLRHNKFPKTCILDHSEVCQRLK